MTRGTISTASSISASVVGAAERQAERAARLVVGVAQGRQHVRRLGRAGRARRADRPGDALEVELHDDRRAVGLADHDGQEVREPLPRMARELDAVLGEDGGPKSLAQPLRRA